MRIVAQICLEPNQENRHCEETKRAEHEHAGGIVAQGLQQRLTSFAEMIDLGIPLVRRKRLMHNKVNNRFTSMPLPRRRRKSHLVLYIGEARWEIDGKADEDDV